MLRQDAYRQFKNTGDPTPTDTQAPQVIPNTPAYDPNWANDPNSVAIHLGGAQYQPGYNSNDKGSYERNFNSQLNNLSPDQLVKRYSQPGITSQLGTGIDKANYQAYNSFKSLIGRDPTAGELSQAIPAFQGGASTGNAWLAQFKQQYDQNPANLQAGAGKYGDQINQVFKSQLGRAATPDEVTHFGSLLGTGNLDSYGLQNFLTGTPEYQKQQDTTFQKDLGGQLENSDVNFFNRAKGGLQSQFAQNGQTLGNSSALDSALADLMGQISQRRSDYMASLTAQQYGGNKQLALGNYNNTMNQYLDQTQQNRNQSLSQQNALMGRANDLTDYNTQKNDYMNFLGSQKSGGPNPLYGALGTLGGAAIGGFAGPAGSIAGAQLGATLGGAAGNAYGQYNYLRQ